jgi:hypothetical protein
MSSVLDFLIIAATAALAARLQFSGLRLRYRAFFSFLLFEVLRGIAFAPLNQAGHTYYRVWTITEPMEWFLFVLVVLEIFSLALQDYPGLATVGRWSLVVAVGIALVAAAATVFAPSHASEQSQLMTYYYLAERAVYFSLAIFLLTILALLTRYPVVLNRNIIVHSLVFSLYFLFITFIYHLMNTSGLRVINLVRYSIESANLGILFVWLALLRPAGEQRKQQLRPHWMPGREEELVGQLNRMNLALQSLIGQ